MTETDDQNFLLHKNWQINFQNLGFFFLLKASTQVALKESANRRNFSPTLVTLKQQ